MNFTDNVKLNWGVFNVTDKEYFQWSEEFVQAADTLNGNANFARLSEAGRNYSVTLKVDF